MYLNVLEKKGMIKIQPTTQITTVKEEAKVAQPKPKP